MRKNIIFTAVIIACALIALLILNITGGTGKTAVITIADGQTITLPLNVDKTYTYGVDTGAPFEFTIEVKDGAARFINSNCPDGLCERFGRITHDYEQAVCAPGGIVLSVRE